MVPVFSKFGNRPVSKEQMRAELSTGRVVLLPGERRISSASGRSKWVPQSQWRNWLKDAAGRKYKAFVRFPEYQKKSKLIKRKKGRIGLSARRPGREAGELLFLGYKDIIPGIPGRATGGKFTAKTSKSPLVSKYGMEAPRKGRGAISQHIAENMPRLTEELWNQRVLDRLAERALSVLVKEVSK